MKYRITYTSRTFVGDYKCIDIERSIVVKDTWIPDGTSLVYAHTDRFNVITIPLEMIKSIAAISE